jgi:HSP20 family protein
MNLPRLNPIRRSGRREFNPLGLLQREIDRLFDDVAQGVPSSSSMGASELMVTMDVAETDKEIELTVELPGIEPKDVDISISGNILTIKGEKKVEKEDKDKNYHRVERSYGSFMRSVELPAGVAPDAIKAAVNNGVLKVTVPKPAAAEAKKIEVKPAA